MTLKIPIVILTSCGPRHFYFCHELAKQFEVKGIIVDDRYRWYDRIRILFKTYGLNPIEVIQAFKRKSKVRHYDQRDAETELRYFPKEKYSDFPAGIPLLYSRDPNSQVCQRQIRLWAPAVICVFGTRLIRDDVLALAQTGALNIHTGLSPYYRGGQCTFWCLYEGDLGHIGVTIHHLTSRIDGGDIIATAQTDVFPDDTVRSIECRLVVQGTCEMIKAVRALSAGLAVRKPQTVRGKLFLSKMYTLDKRLELEKRLKQGWIQTLLAQSKTDTDR